MPSLAEIVLIGAQQRADSLRRQSEIDYNRGAQRNALWLNLGTNLAQLGTNAYVDYRKLQAAKAAAVRDAANDQRDYGLRKDALTLQQQAAERTRRADELALTQKQQAEMLLASGLRPGLEGAPPRYDYGDMQTAAGQMTGAQTVLPGAMKTAAEQNEMFAKIDQQHLNTAAGYAYSVFRAGNTPEAYEAALGDAYRRRDISQEQHDQLMASPHDTTEKVATLTTALLSKSNDPRHMKLFEPVTMTPGSRQYVPIQGFDKPVAEVPERQTFTSTDRMVGGKVTSLREAAGRYYDTVTGKEVLGSLPLPTAAQVNFNLGNQPPTGDFSKTGDEFLQGVPPQWQQTVKNIATYKTLPGTILSARDAATKRMIMQWVQQYNPTFDEGVAPARIATRKDFTSGQKSRNIVALNTAISHAGKLADLATAINNGDTPVVNSVVNYVRTQLGHSEVTNAQTAMTALAGEAATTFKSSGATDPEIAKWSAATNTSQSPKQMMDGLKTTAELFAGRFYALAGEYENAMGAKDINFLTRDARAQLQKFGIDPNAWEPEGAATVFGPGRGGGPAATSAQPYTGPAPMQGRAGTQWAGRYFVTIPNGPTVEVKPDGRGGWIYVTPGAR